MICANVHIEAGAYIDSSIILDHTRLSGFASFQRKVVGPNFCFDPDGTVLNSQHTDTDWIFSDARSSIALRNEDQLLVMAQSLEVSSTKPEK